MDAIKEYFRIADKLEHEEITLQEYEEQCQSLRDVQEVVHGRWIDHKCSLCGFEPYDPSGLDTFNFCSNCGADMRGDEDGV